MPLRAMELHAASFLSCPRVARWLTDPRPPSSAQKELLTKLRTVHLWRCPPAPLGHATAPCAEPECITYVAADVCDAHGHVLCFATGAVLGAPDDALRACSATTRIALDPGRRAAIMFEHSDDGATTVALDCFDEAGDSYADVRYFAPRAGASVGSFPETLSSASKVVRRRDCPPCTKDRRVCECQPRTRLDTLLKAARKARRRRRCTTRSKDGRVASACYPAWQQALDAYVDSRMGNYVVQVQHTPICSSTKPAAYQLAYRARYAAAPHAVREMKVCETILGGVPHLLPSHSGPVYCGPRTLSVDAKNTVSTVRELELVDDLRKLPGFRYDYLLGVPSNHFPPVAKPTLPVVHCEDANKCPQPANLCLSFGALLQPASAAAECASPRRCETSTATPNQGCTTKTKVPDPSESNRKLFELPNNNTKTKLWCDEPLKVESKGIKVLPSRCDVSCNPPPSLNCTPRANKHEIVKFTDIQCHMFKCPEPAPGPGKRPRPTAPSIDQCTAKRRCAPSSPPSTPQRRLNDTKFCRPTQEDGGCTLRPPTPESTSYLNSQTDSPGTSWGDSMSSGSGVFGGCANVKECCPPVAVRDEWELPSRAAAYPAAASLVCPPSTPGEVVRPPSPCVCNPTNSCEIVDTITGDVKELSNGGVRESNQKAVLKWLRRETPMFPLTLT